jgi:thiamine biosynthesis lipoprotein
MLYRNEFRAMGSKMLALVDAKEEPSILLQVPEWFEQWEQILSRFRLDSELSQMNLHAGSVHRSSRVLWDVYQAARKAEAMTNGLVNPLVLPALLRAGYDKTFDSLSARVVPAGPAAGESYYREELDRSILPNLVDLEVDSRRWSLRLPDGAALDFGGIAKGRCAEVAAQRLRKAGPALVSAGGDIAVTGARADGEPWMIGVEDPFGGEDFVETIYVERGGVATSGRDHRHWWHGGVQQHHIIDPRTGVPANTDILTATVIAPDTVQAEAMAKAVLISGSRIGLDWLDRKEALAGILILESGQRLFSRNIEQFL